MNILKRIIKYLLVKIACYYIEFVYKTSKIKIAGKVDILNENNDEKFIIGFWHGESYCYYPLLKNRKICVITTKSKRGDYISNIIEYFGYTPIRVADVSKGNNYIFKIRDKINGSEKRNLGLALDGALGPYHIPKKFAIFIAKASKRRIVTISIKVRYKINLLNRWDKYIIPLPFNKIDVCINDPIEVEKRRFEEISEKIINLMNIFKPLGK